MGAIDDLCRSWLDLSGQFDPAAGSRMGLPGADGRLGRFDAEAVRMHVSALRSIAAAAEDADVEVMDEEIDRTALLNRLRAEADLWEREQPQQRNPDLWAAHLQGALAVLAEREGGWTATSARALAGRLADLPAFVQAATTTIERPAPVLAEAAVARLADLAQRLLDARAGAAAAVPDEARELQVQGDAALGALATLSARCRAWAEPDPERAERHALGLDLYDRRLHHEHALAAGAPELWRVVQHLLDDTDRALDALADQMAHGRPWRVMVDDYEDELLARAGQLDQRLATLDEAATLVRRAVVARTTLEGFGLILEERVAEGAGDDPERHFPVVLHRRWHAARAEVDLALHTRGLPPAEAEERLLELVPVTRAVAHAAVARLCAAPTYGVAAVIGRRDLLALEADARAARGDAWDPAAFHADFVRLGALPATLMRWGMGLD